MNCTLECKVLEKCSINAEEITENDLVYGLFLSDNRKEIKYYILKMVQY